MFELSKVKSTRARFSFSGRGRPRTNLVHLQRFIPWEDLVHMFYPNDWLSSFLGHRGPKLIWVSLASLVGTLPFKTLTAFIRWCKRCVSFNGGNGTDKFD